MTTMIIKLKLLRMFLFILNLLILFLRNVDMNVSVATKVFMKIILLSLSIVVGPIGLLNILLMNFVI